MKNLNNEQIKEMSIGGIIAYYANNKAVEPKIDYSKFGRLKESDK